MSTLEHFPLRIDVLISHNYRMTWYSIHLIWFGHNIPSLPPHIPPDQRCQGIFLHLFCMSMWLWSFNHATSTVFNISLVRMQAPIVPYIMICLTVIPQGLDASTNCQYHMKVQTQLRQTNILMWTMQKGRATYIGTLRTVYSTCTTVVSTLTWLLTNHTKCFPNI